MPERKPQHPMHSIAAPVEWSVVPGRSRSSQAQPSRSVPPPLPPPPNPRYLQASNQASEAESDGLNEIANTGPDDIQWVKIQPVTDPPSDVEALALSPSAATVPPTEPLINQPSNGVSIEPLVEGDLLEDELFNGQGLPVKSEAAAPPTRDRPTPPVDPDATTLYQVQTEGPLTYFSYYFEDLGSVSPEAEAERVSRSKLKWGLIGTGVVAATVVSGLVIGDAWQKAHPPDDAKPNDASLQPNPATSLTRSPAVTSSVTPERAPTRPQSTPPAAPPKSVPKPATQALSGKTVSLPTPRLNPLPAQPELPPPITPPPPIVIPPMPAPVAIAPPPIPKPAAPVTPTRNASLGNRRPAISNPPNPARQSNSISPNTPSLPRQPSSWVAANIPQVSVAEAARRQAALANVSPPETLPVETTATRSPENPASEGAENSETALRLTAPEANAAPRSDEATRPNASEATGLQRLFPARSAPPDRRDRAANSPTSPLSPPKPEMGQTPEAGALSRATAPVSSDLLAASTAHANQGLGIQDFVNLPKTTSPTRSLSWMPLTEQAATEAMNVPKIGAFTVRQVSQPDYQKEWATRNQSDDPNLAIAYPAYGFIDYQRQVIVVLQARSPVMPSQSRQPLPPKS